MDRGFRAMRHSATRPQPRMAVLGASSPVRRAPAKDSNPEPTSGPGTKRDFYPPAHSRYGSTGRAKDAALAIFGDMFDIGVVAERRSRNSPAQPTRLNHIERHVRPHPDPRFRQPGDPADRAPRARKRRLLRDPPVHDRRRQSPRFRAARGHFVGRAGLGHRGDGTARPRCRLQARRAGARHLLRHADDVRRIGRPRDVERAPGIRSRLCRHSRRLPAVRRAVAKGRPRAGVDEPWRQGRHVAGRVSRRCG